MNVAMFIVGFCVFTVYVGFLMWNIFYNHNKNREENYPNYYSRHGQIGSMEKRFKTVNKEKRKKFNSKI